MDILNDSSVGDLDTNNEEKDKINDMSYEEAFYRMQEVLERLENGNVKLDESLKLYEEGIKLYRYCNRILGEAELKITKFNTIKGEEGVDL